MPFEGIVRIVQISALALVLPLALVLLARLLVIFFSGRCRSFLSRPLLATTILDRLQKSLGTLFGDLLRKFAAKGLVIGLRRGQL